MNVVHGLAYKRLLLFFDHHHSSFFCHLLGVGAFGWVWLVRKNENRQLYAMKILKKQDVVRRRQLAHVQAERDILAEADSEWVVKLFFSFQDSHALYLVMEYIPGKTVVISNSSKERKLFYPNLSGGFLPFEPGTNLLASLLLTYAANLEKTNRHHVRYASDLRPPFVNLSQHSFWGKPLLIPIPQRKLYLANIIIITRS